MNIMGINILNNVHDVKQKSVGESEKAGASFKDSLDGVKDTLLSSVKQHDLKCTTLDNVSKDIKFNDNASVRKKDTKKDTEGATIDTELDKDDTDTTKEAQEKVMELLTSTLGVSTEQVEQAMEKTGLTIEKLGNRENILSLIAEIQGISPEDMLYSNKDLKSIMALLENIEEAVKDSIIALDDAELANIKTNGLEDSEVVAVEDVNITEGNEGNYNIKTDVNSDSDTNLEGNIDGLNQDIDTSMVNVSDIFSNNIEEELSKINAIHKAQNVAHEKIDRQILSKIDIKELENGKEMTMDLNPKELGKLVFKLVKENGVYTAIVKVENDRAKQAVDGSLTELKENLEQKGIEVTSIQVEIKDSQHQSSMEQEKKKSAKRINDIMSKHKQDIELEDAQERTLNKSHNSIEVDVLI